MPISYIYVSLTISSILSPPHISYYISFFPKGSLHIHMSTEKKVLLQTYKYMCMLQPILALEKSSPYILYSICICVYIFWNGEINKVEVESWSHMPWLRLGMLCKHYVCFQRLWLSSRSVFLCGRWLLCPVVLLPVLLLLLLVFLLDCWWIWTLSLKCFLIKIVIRIERSDFSKIEGYLMRFAYFSRSRPAEFE